MKKMKKDGKFSVPQEYNEQPTIHHPQRFRQKVLLEIPTAYQHENRIRNRKAGKRRSVFIKRLPGQA